MIIQVTCYKCKAKLVDVELSAEQEIGIKNNFISPPMKLCEGCKVPGIYPNVLGDDDVPF